MSLLTIVQNAAREVGLEVPASVIGNTNSTAIKLNALVRRACKNLIRRHRWEVLTIETTIVTTTATSYALPNDFLNPVNYTHWDRTNELKMWGPFTPQEWQLIKSGIADASTRKRFRIVPVTGVKQLTLDTAPIAGETLVYEYVSKNFVIKASDSSLTDEFVADGDTTVFDEELITMDVIWRQLDRLGLQYLEAKNDFELYLESAIANDGGSKELSLDRTPLSVLAANIQDGNFPSA